MTAAERRAKLKTLGWLRTYQRMAEREAREFREAADAVEAELTPRTTEQRPKADGWKGQAKQEGLL